MGDAELGQLDHDAGAPVNQAGQPVRVGDGRQFGHRDLRGEADQLEVRGVDLEQGARLGADGALVVRRVGLVGRADLDEAGAALRHHVRHPEGAADLDELAAADEHLPAVAEGGEHQQHGSGVVVDDHGGFSAGETAEELLDVSVP